ncbi:O-antigen polymerase [Acinetobacter indicus]|nr:O-antigen polymerase [Acinetobacter indicus]
MVPVLLTASNKVEALELNNNIVVSIFYEMFPAIGLLMAYKFKNKKYLLIFLVMTLVVMFLGTRRAFAMSLIGIMIIQVSESFRLVSMYKYILFGIASLMLIILGKTFYGYVLFYGLFDGFNEWKNNFTLNYFFEGSEFLTTSAILQSVAQNNFTVDSINIYKSLLAIQPIPLDFFGFSSSFFNDAFQPILFPSLNYGMAYNPWAEAYSWFGYIGVFVYGLIFPLILTFFWKGYKTSTQIFSILFLVLGITLAFWIQRNSLGSILAYIRNILYPFLMIILLVSIVKKFLVKYK